MLQHRTEMTLTQAAGMIANCGILPKLTESTFGVMQSYVAQEARRTGSYEDRSESTGRVTQRNVNGLLHGRFGEPFSRRQTGPTFSL